MKKGIKRLCAVLLSALLLCGFLGVPALADGEDVREEETLSGAGKTGGKEEVVYATLGADGSVSGVYVVNVLEVLSAGRLTDYGDYAEVKNLTNLEPISCEDGVVSAAGEEGRFYYQGNLQDASLPWKVEIAYALDGAELSAKELAGKDGRLELHIRTAHNSGADASCYENYMLQISVTLDAERCKNLTAEGATLANAGKNKLVTFTVMPGTDGDLSLSADVRDFEMEGISISAVPFSMDISMPDLSGMTGEFGELSSAVTQLSDGSAALAEGVKELQTGADALKDGSAEYRKGIETLNAGSSELTDASEDIRDALSALSSALDEGLDAEGLSALSALPGALDQFAAGIDEISGGLSALGEGFEQAYGALDGAISSIPEAIPESDLQALAVKNYGDAAFMKLLEQYQAAQTVKGTYEAVRPAFAAVGGTLDTLSQSLDKISGSLQAVSRQLSGSLADFDADALSELADGIGALAAGYAEFHQGLLGYTGGVSELAGNYAALDGGIGEFAAGTGTLTSGTQQLADGLSQLNDNTKDLPAQIDETIDELLSGYDTSDFEPVSFVSAKNEGVHAVQFVFTTEGVAKEKIVEPEPEPVEENFWTRLKNLFSW